MIPERKAELEKRARMHAEVVASGMLEVLMWPSIGRGEVTRAREAMDKLSVVMLQLDPEDDNV